jgi:hypothetical protein
MWFLVPWFNPLAFGLAIATYNMILDGHYSSAWSCGAACLIIYFIGLCMFSFIEDKNECFFSKSVLPAILGCNRIYHTKRTIALKNGYTEEIIKCQLKKR